MKPKIDQFYHELDLETTADLDSVRQTYRQLVKVWHPDRFGSDHRLQALANEKLKKINLAYEGIVAFLESGESRRPSDSRDSAPTSKPQETLSGDEVYRAGLQLYNSRDYNGALALFLEASEMGNAAAQYAVGTLYYYHRKVVPIFGTAKHFAEVFRWWSRAAENGHPDAQFVVGTHHQSGVDTPFDLSEARKWLERAASKGHAGAKARLETISVLDYLNAIPIISTCFGKVPPVPPFPK